jgi:hypothetical protein
MASAAPAGGPAAQPNPPVPVLRNKGRPAGSQSRYLEARRAARTGQPLRSHRNPGWKLPVQACARIVGGL